MKQQEEIYKRHDADCVLLLLLKTQRELSLYVEQGQGDLSRRNKPNRIAIDESNRHDTTAAAIS